MPTQHNTILIIGGGQSGLAAARTVRDAGHNPIILEAGATPVGSWGRYYDSLTLFSPARYSNFPNYPFPADPDHYPHRDEVTAYLQGYADWLSIPIHTNQHVTTITTDTGGYLISTASGDTYRADGVVAATGSFGNPYLPELPGRNTFTGTVRHSAEYRDPEPLTGQRVVVVGAGNSAIQIAYELADVATVTLAVRSPLQLVPQIRAGKDMHFWLKTLGLDLLPPAALTRLFHGTLVFDTGIYQTALDTGVLDQRPMFTAFTPDGVTWADQTSETVDTVIFATGYRPHLPYLQELGALDPNGRPQHNKGLSTTHPRLAYLGIEFQRSFSSNTLRGVHRDAHFILHRLDLQRGPSSRERGRRHSLT